MERAVVVFPLVLVASEFPGVVLVPAGWALSPFARIVLLIFSRSLDMVTDWVKRAKIIRIRGLRYCLCEAGELGDGVGKWYWLV
jgi:hypothetical protein